MSEMKYTEEEVCKLLFAPFRVVGDDFKCKSENWVFPKTRNLLYCLP